MLATLVSMFISVFTIDKFTRVQQTFFSAGCAVLSNLLMLVFGLVSGEKEGGSTLVIKIFVVITMLITIFTYNLGLGSFIYIIAGEMLPYEYKSLGQTIQSVFLWTLYGVNNYWFPVVFDSIGSYVFIIYAGVNVLGIVFVYFYAVESKRRTSDEIQDDFESFRKCCCW